MDSANQIRQYPTGLPSFQLIQGIFEHAAAGAQSSGSRRGPTVHGFGMVSGA